MIMFLIGFTAGTLLGGAIDMFIFALLSANGDGKDKEDKNVKKQQ